MRSTEPRAVKVIRAVLWLVVGAVFCFGLVYEFVNAIDREAQIEERRVKAHQRLMAAFQD